MAPLPPPAPDSRTSLPDRLRRAARVNLAGGVPLERVVGDLFEAVLLRPADPDSLGYYVAALRRGVPWARVVEAVHTSAEAVDNSHRMPFTTSLGPAVLGRVRNHGAEPAVYLCDLPGSGSGAVLERLAGQAGDRLVLSGLTLDQLLWTPELIRRQASLLGGPWGRAPLPLLAPAAFKAVVVAHPVTRVARQLRSMGVGPGVGPGPEAGGGGGGDPALERALADIPTDPQARCLAAEVDIEGAWIRWAPEDGGGPAPLQSLLERGGADVAEADLARRAVAALDSFDLAVPAEQADRVLEAVSSLWGRPGPSVGAAGAAGPGGPEADLPAPLARRVLAGNRADLALYEAVRDRARSQAGRE